MDRPLIWPLFLSCVLAIWQPVKGASLCGFGDMSKRGDANQWSVVAAKDIEQASRIISEAHPGVLLPSDVAFHLWHKQGLTEALQLAKLVRTRDQALAAVRFYLAGYRDGHVGVREQVVNRREIRWAGWTAAFRGDKFVVVHRAENWTSELPNLNTKVLACDGTETTRFLSDRVAPYVDLRMNLGATLSRLAVHLSMDHPTEVLFDRALPSVCTFQDELGNAKVLKLDFQDSVEGLQSIGYAPQPPAVRSWGIGRYWVNVSDFTESLKNLAVQKAVNATARGLASKAKLIVLDTRGNNGGNSVIGYELLRAILKESMPEQLNPPIAYWRVSSIARQALQSGLDSAVSAGGSDTASVAFSERMIERMDEAKKNGEVWVRQEQTNFSYKDEDNNGPFSGVLILLTDSYCASACLDFADLVLRVPNSVHVGSTTSADTEYLDIAEISLPSGLSMWTPLKFWSGRARGKNEPLTPKFRFDGDMRNDAAVEAWIEHQVLPSIPGLVSP